MSDEGSPDGFDARDAIPAEAIDVAADALIDTHDQDVPWETYAKAALEAAAPAIRAQERERIVARIEQEKWRQGYDAFHGKLSEWQRTYNRAIDDCLRAIRSEGDDE